MSNRRLYVWGGIAVVIGVLSAITQVLNHLPADQYAPEYRGEVTTIYVFSLLAKTALAVGGGCMLARTRLAVPVLVLAAIFSAIHSYFIWPHLPPPPPGLSDAGRTGRVFGHGLGLIVPPLFDLMLASIAARYRSSRS